MFGPDGPRLSELMRQALSSTRGGYDMLAPKFDATPFRTPDSVLEPVMGYLAEGPRIGRALDLCCGTAAATRRLREVCDHVVGVDFSPGMLAVARARLSEEAGSPWALVRSDARALPFVACFDVVTCFGALGHFPPPEQPRLLAQVARVLRPGGRLVVVTGEAPSPRRPAFWALHGFNAVMRFRNALIRPPFVMYYLEFCLPEAADRLAAAGLEPEVRPLGLRSRPDLALLIGHKSPGDSGASALGRPRF